jgi:5-methylcytosine-specific restriction endonuclease McrA
MGGIAMKTKGNIFKDNLGRFAKSLNWSVCYLQCLRCGTTKVPHEASGYCKKCYPMWFYYQNHEKLKTEARIRAQKLRMNSAFRIKKKGWDRKYREEKREKCRRLVRNWKERNPDRVRFLNRKRRLGNPTPSNETLNILLSKPPICSYCGKKIEGRDLTIDHVIPISHGGTNILANLVLACRSCNERKRDRTLEEFYILQKKEVKYE